jgi:hypothetical protein
LTLTAGVGHLSAHWPFRKAKSMRLRRDLYRICAVPKQVDHLFQMGAQLSSVYTLGMRAGETRSDPLPSETH